MLAKTHLGEQQIFLFLEVLDDRANFNGLRLKLPNLNFALQDRIAIVGVEACENDSIAGDIFAAHRHNSEVRSVFPDFKRGRKVGSHHHVFEQPGDQRCHLRPGLDSIQSPGNRPIRQRLQLDGALLWHVRDRDDSRASDLFLGQIKGDRFRGESISHQDGLQMLAKCCLDGRNVLAVDLDIVGESANNRRADKVPDYPNLSRPLECRRLSPAPSSFNCFNTSNLDSRSVRVR